MASALHNLSSYDPTTVPDGSEYKIAITYIKDGVMIEINSNLSENEIIKIIESMN